MITRTTITLDDKLKKEAQAYCVENNVRGGLSGLIEVLLKQQLVFKETNRAVPSADYLEYLDKMSQI